MNVSRHLFSDLSRRAVPALVAMISVPVWMLWSAGAEFDHSSLESFSMERSEQTSHGVDGHLGGTHGNEPGASPGHPPVAELHIPRLTVRTNVSTRMMESPRLTTPNLVPEKNGNGAATIDEWEIQLNKAREARAEHDYELAANILIFLLESATSDSINSTSMFELAQVTEEAGQLVRAEQIFAQFINEFPKDARIPEVYLRRGLLFRRMGAYRQAKNAFFSAMSQSLSHNDQRIAFHAQTEIADTYMMESDYQTAVGKYKLLLKKETEFSILNGPFLRYKMINAISMLGDPIRTAAEANQFLTKYPDSEYAPDVRFLLAKSLKDRQLNDEATREILALMKDQKQKAAEDPGNYGDWIYWQQRAGNEIANNLYRDGQYQNALHVYTRLSEISSDPEWQLPVIYQIGLCSEHLDFTKRAVESYEKIVRLGGQIPDKERLESLSTVVEMARWRLGQINWREDMRVASEGVRNQLESAPKVSPEMEETSFEKMATIYSSMAPEAAVAIFTEMDDETVIGIARHMESHRAAIVLSKLANVSDEEARRAAFISETLSLEIANDGTTEQ